MPRRFPFEPARDLLGILRCVRAEERGRPLPSSTRLRKTERLARDLTDAIASAEQHDPGTAPYDRALGKADGVALRVADLVEIYTPIEPALRAASKRVLGAGVRGRERDIKWAMGRKRG